MLSFITRLLPINCLKPFTQGRHQKTDDNHHPDARTKTTPPPTKMSAPNQFAGKVAIVTGGSKGIGKAVSLALGARGASVVVNYNSDASAAADVAKTIGDKNALAVQADVSTIAGVETLIDQTVKRFGKIDILIPNAGVLPMKDLEHTTPDDFDHTFATNVKGPYFLAQVREEPPDPAEYTHISLIFPSRSPFL